MAFLSVLELLLPPHCHYPCTCVCANEEGHKKATQCIANKRFLRLSCAPVLALPLPLPSPLDAAEHTLVRCHYRTPFGALPWPTATQPPALSAAQRAFFVRQLRAFMLGFGPLLRLPNGARRQRRRRSRVQLELVCLTVWLSAAAFIPRDLRAIRMRFPSRLAVLWNKFKINWIKFNCTFFRILTSGLGHWLGGGVTSVRLYLLDLKCLTFIWIVNKNKSPRFVYILLCGLWLLYYYYYYYGKMQMSIAGIKIYPSAERNFWKKYSCGLFIFHLSREWVSFWITLPPILKSYPTHWHLFFPFSLFTAHCAFLNFVTHCDQISRNCNLQTIFASVLSDKYLCDGIGDLNPHNSSRKFDDISTISLIQISGSAYSR